MNEQTQSAPINFLPEAYELAKAWRGGHRMEKQALVALTGPTWQNNPTLQVLSEECGFAESSLRYGIVGKRNTDGSLQFPGLLHRGFVVANGAKFSVCLNALRKAVKSQSILKRRAAPKA